MNACSTARKYDDWLEGALRREGRVRSAASERERACQQHRRLRRTEPARRRSPSILQSISLYTDGDEQPTDNAVRLMSLHASKGLEFDVVYMIGVEHGILPHEKAVKDRGETRARRGAAAVLRRLHAGAQAAARSVVPEPAGSFSHAIDRAIFLADPAEPVPRRGGIDVRCGFRKSKKARLTR